MRKDKSKTTFWQYHKPWTVTNLVEELAQIRIEELRPTSNLQIHKHIQEILDEL